MAYDWLPFTTSEYSVGAPATATHFERWFTNPIAIAEGASGAPYEASQWRPYSSTKWGDGATGLIYNSAVDPAAAIVTTPTFELGWDYRIAIAGLTCSTSSSLDFTFAALIAGSWTGSRNIGTAGAGSLQRWGAIEIDNPCVSRGAQFFDVAAGVTGGTSNTWAAQSANAEIRSTSGSCTAIRLAFSTGNISGGKLALYRRRSAVEV